MSIIENSIYVEEEEVDFKTLGRPLEIPCKGNPSERTFLRQSLLVRFLVYSSLTGTILISFLKSLSSVRYQWTYITFRNKIKTRTKAFEFVFPAQCTFTFPICNNLKQQIHSENASDLILCSSRMITGYVEYCNVTPTYFKDPAKTISINFHINDSHISLVS